MSWLVRDIIPEAAILVVFGPPKSGKSFVTTDLVLHAAHGMHWHGHSIPRRLRCALLLGEGLRGQPVRMRGWQMSHEPEREGEMRVRRRRCHCMR